MDLEKLKQNLETRYQWIWDEDLDAQLAKAEAIMNGNCL